MKPLAVLAVLIAATLAAGARAEEVKSAHQCRLSDDRKSVTVSISNPFAQDTHCRVDCHLPIGPGGMASVSCAKEVPANTQDFVLCTRSRDNGQPYLKVESSAGFCVRQEAALKDKDEDDDEMIKRLTKQGQDLLKGMKQ